MPRTHAIPNRLGRALAILVCLAAAAAHAEIYRWRDAEGRLHFTQDLNQVPPAHRAAAEASAREADKAPEIQHYRTAPAAADPRSSSAAGTTATAGESSSVFGRAKRARPSAPAAKTYRIPVSRAGNSMMVRVRLNDSVVASFQVDTGATDVLIPQSVADQLGLDLSTARTAVYGTANGYVQQRLVTLESVDLGGARVENVPASISPSMTHGLLGLSYFNHFRYHVDPVAGIVTLTPNGLAEAGIILGGRTEPQWRGEFAQLAARRQAIERALDEINPNWTVRKRELEGYLEENDRQVEVLESEADDARVPMAWRD